MEPSAIFAPGVLDGLVAIVTGGGTGLGRAAAIELARCGARVVIAGRRAEVLEAAAPQIGDGTVVVPADVRDPQDAERIVRTALDAHGRLDVLVNNAGGQYFAPAEAIELKGWQAVHRLNLEATERMGRTAYELAFRAQRAGTVVNVTLSPHHGLAGMTHSSAARAAVEGYTRALAADWAPDGVSVVALAAGHFLTEAIAKYPDVVRENAARSVPLGRLGDPQEHGWLVALCATPLGRALSGSVITLDGGRDNWFGPWPPEALTDRGEVPTEARRPA
jgi:citronellol/citronellal dehydrogenase